MKKTLKRLSILVICAFVFAICIVFGSNLEQSFIVYTDGFVDNGDIKTMNITSFYGFSDEGRDRGIYKASLGIPEDGKVQLRIKANTEGNDKILMSFKDDEGNIIFEETNNNIFLSKTIDAKKGEWHFEINGQDVETGDFKFIVLQK